MVMCKLCAGFVSTTIRARLRLLEKNIGTFATFYANITEISHTKNVMYFLDRGCVRTLCHLYGYASGRLSWPWMAGWLHTDQPSS